MRTMTWHEERAARLHAEMVAEGVPADVAAARIATKFPKLRAGFLVYLGRQS